MRRDGVPEALPGQAEFATGTTHLGATYESAWLACVLLADRGGERALVRFYDSVSSGTPLATALRQGFGLSEARADPRTGSNGSGSSPADFGTPLSG